jgi:tRNA 5-methylaminomethyl-2-thiouridine biosynthesis bifunctional protein
VKRSEPLQAAVIEWGADGLPRAPLFGDVYHPAVGAWAQARHVFIAGNGLPGRWAGRDRFVVLETGFGLGNNFLATWQAWRDDPARCRRLWFVSVEAHPPRLDDLRRAHHDSPAPELARDLLAAWPPAVPGLHTLEFDAGQVVLLLALGDARQLLPQLRLAADAIYLDGFAPARNAAMWSPDVFERIARLAAPGATAATWSVARELREGLTHAGFTVQTVPGIGGKREICVARFAPRFTPRPPPAEAPPASIPRHVAVVGSGIAGACVARALRAEGVSVTLVDAAPAPARGASGNPAGLIHGVLHADDGPHARWLRAGALQSARDLAERLQWGTVAGDLAGLLRLDADAPAAQALLARDRWPAEAVQWLDRDEASQRLGLELPHGGWWWPQGGWVDPAGWVHHEVEALRSGGLHWVAHARVDRLERTADGAGWRLLDPSGQTLTEADAVVLANAEGVSRLSSPWADAGWPLSRSRGQISWTAFDATLAHALASQSYAIATPAGLLIGATSDPDAEGHDDTPVADAHCRNLVRLASLAPALAERLRTAGRDHAQHWQGRVAWRLRADDRLPLAGPLATTQAHALMPTQVGRVPRVPGLHALAALGSRGLSLAPLAARLVVARLLGTPWPVERSLAEAVDPARYAVRRARRGGA